MIVKFRIAGGMNELKTRRYVAAWVDETVRLRFNDWNIEVLIGIGEIGEAH